MFTSDTCMLSPIVAILVVAIIVPDFIAIVSRGCQLGKTFPLFSWILKFGYSIHVSWSGTKSYPGGDKAKYLSRSITRGREGGKNWPRVVSRNLWSIPHTTSIFKSFTKQVNCHSSIDNEMCTMIMQRSSFSILCMIWFVSVQCSG